MKRPGRPRVEPPARGTIDARTIRLNSRGVGSTQDAFAQAIGVSVKTLRNWEQRRREPTGPARVLLTLLQRDPWLVFDLAKGQHGITPAAYLMQPSALPTLITPMAQLQRQEALPRKANAAMSPPLNSGSA
jgi:transcriptional regulator with XRE-family HTH domain